MLPDWSVNNLLAHATASYVLYSTYFVILDSMESTKRHKKAGDMLHAALWEEAGQRGIKCYDMPVVVISKVPEGNTWCSDICS